VAEETYLIAGLGNPGANYENTRHNVGFQVVDAIARSEKEYLELSKWDAQYCRVSLWGARLFFVKPQTFMNLSGKSVARFADFFKISPGNILVIHDDIDMHPGRIKLVASGGPGGHNGIRSLIQCLGTRDFFRLKYGVGRPGQNGVHADIPVERFVLAPFSADEQVLLEKRMAALIEGVRAFVTSGSQQAMNILNVIK
jgi:PTH1 family peptidyl-tRNA hydrolase